jgi:hypothetical protein
VTGGPGFRVRALHLLSLSAFAVAVPVLGAYAESPTYFVARGATALHVGALVLAVVAAPAAPFLAIAALARVAGPRCVAGAHLAGVGALVALALLPALHRSAPAWGALAAALAAGVAAAAAYRRWAAVRSLVTFLSPALLVIPGMFLARLPRDAAPPPAPAAEARAARPRSVIMVVFDELPLVTLLDRDRAIDPVRFPNLASLAREGTWFRNAVASASHTEHAVPAILSGTFPRPGAAPTAGEYPGALFEALEPTHELHALESCTRLCAPRSCSADGGPVGAGVAPILTDAAVVAAHVFSPPPLRSRLPPLDGRWLDFFRSTADAEEGVLPRVRAYLAAMRPPGDRPAVHVLHLETLPHAPFRYLPSGQRYFLDREPPRDLRDEAAALDDHRRHVLQVAAADTVLGEILGRVRQLGMLEGAVVVVTADHGASFAPGRASRGLDEVTFGDIAFVPLLVRGPGFAPGEVSDAPMQTVDVWPTVAEALGLPLGRRDGRPASVVAREGAAVRRVRHHEAVFTTDASTRELDGALRRKLAAVGDGAFAAMFERGPGAGLVHREVSALAQGEPTERAGTIRAPERWAAVDPGAPVLPARVTGNAGSPGSVELAVAVNGTVAAVTRSDARGDFGVVIPWDLLRRGGNSLELFEVRRAAAATLHRIPQGAPAERSARSRGSLQLLGNTPMYAGRFLDPARTPLLTSADPLGGATAKEPHVRTPR